MCDSHNNYGYMVEKESKRGQIPTFCIFGRHITVCSTLLCPAIYCFKHSAVLRLLLIYTSLTFLCRHSAVELYLVFSSPFFYINNKFLMHSVNMHYSPINHIYYIFRSSSSSYSRFRTRFYIYCWNIEYRRNIFIYKYIYINVWKLKQIVL